MWRVSVLLILLLPTALEGQGFLEARYMVAGGVSPWLAPNEGWGGSLEAGVFPGDSFKWQFLAYVTHAPFRNSGLRARLSTFGVEALYAGRERRGGRGLRLPIGVGIGALHFAADTASSYLSGWRATLSLSIRPELWITQQVGIFLESRLLYPFAGQEAGPIGDFSGPAFLANFGLSWRW